jgi:4-amino-4-deoxy-L-arabinose transferase-like glycosyltransferase
MKNLMEWRAAHWRWVGWGVVAAALALHFVHLAADLPQHTRFAWESAVLTDEGWYCSGAINRVLWGHWRLQGEFNPMVPMPVWHWIAYASFRIGGFGIISLRAAAVVTFCGCVLLAARLAWLLEGELAAWVVALLFAVDSFAYAFSRTAFLELPSIFFFTAALVLIARRDRQTMVRYLLAGVLLALAMLSKLTVVAMFPACVYLAWERADYAVSAAAKRIGAGLAVWAAALAAYWFAYAGPHRDDFFYYFASDKNEAVRTLAYFIAAWTRPVRKGTSISPLLFYFALGAILLAVAVPQLRRLWRRPLFTVGAIWMVMDLVFMAQHNYAPPRYYMALMPALFLVAVSVLQWSRERATGGSQWMMMAMAVLLAADLAGNGAQMLGYIHHAQYTARDSTAAMKQVIEREPQHSMVISGHGAYFVALWTGLQPVNYEYGVDDFATRVKQYKPGWFVGEDFGGPPWFAHEQLDGQFTLTPVGEFPIFAERPPGWLLYRIDRR